MSHVWLSAMLAVALFACGYEQCISADTPRRMDGSADAPGRENLIPVRIMVGSVEFIAQFSDTAPARVLLEQMPFTVEMRDHAGQEKVVQLPYAFPAATAVRPSIIEDGELYLWSSDRLVLFYTTFRNSYGGYVRLGRIEDTTGLLEALGHGVATVTFSL